MLLESDTQLSDNTFKVRPSIFAQLWVIHSNFGNKTLHCTFFLISGKSQADYTIALNLFKAELDKLLEDYLNDHPKKRRR